MGIACPMVYLGNRWFISIIDDVNRTLELRVKSVSDNSQKIHNGDAVIISVAFVNLNRVPADKIHAELVPQQFRH